MDGLCEDHRDGSFVRAYDRICREEKQKETEWIKKLRAFGIKAAHPNDGWHEKEHQEVTLCYPRFNDGVEIGDQIALGDPDVFVVVKILKKTSGLRSATYSYGWSYK
jgi:hypothetical protein